MENETVLRDRIDVWNPNRNARSNGIDWQFKTSDARFKLRRLYPQMTAC